MAKERKGRTSKYPAAFYVKAVKYFEAEMTAYEAIDKAANDTGVKLSKSFETYPNSRMWSIKQFVSKRRMARDADYAK